MIISHYEVSEKRLIMFCAKCGTELRDGAKFCPLCGKNTGNNPDDKIQSTKDFTSIVGTKYSLT